MYNFIQYTGQAFYSAYEYMTNNADSDKTSEESSSSATTYTSNPDSTRSNANDIPIAQPFYTKIETESRSQFFMRIGEETQQAYKNGYILNNKHIKVDNTNLIKCSEQFDTLEKLNPPTTKYPTKISVVDGDTFEVGLKLKEAHKKTPLVINMANRFGKGGGFLRGDAAQEEDLCRRSNLYRGLEKLQYPFNENGVIYTPYVQVFRNSKSFTFFDEPKELDVAGIAAYNLKADWATYEGKRVKYDRELLGLPLKGNLTIETLHACNKYIEGTNEKIRNFLRLARKKNYTTLVLGALGCGAFINPPALISQLFKDVLKEEEFDGAFEEIVFANLVVNHSDINNLYFFLKEFRDEKVEKIESSELFINKFQEIKQNFIYTDHYNPVSSKRNEADSENYDKRIKAKTPGTALLASSDLPDLSYLRAWFQEKPDSLTKLATLTWDKDKKLGLINLAKDLQEMNSKLEADFKKEKNIPDIKPAQETYILFKKLLSNINDITSEKCREQIDEISKKSKELSSRINPATEESAGITRVPSPFENEETLLSLPSSSLAPIGWKDT